MLRNVGSKEIIDTAGYLTLCTRCRINLWRYNRVRLYCMRCSNVILCFVGHCLSYI